MNMEKAVSSVIWSFKSFRWDIRHFSEICGLNHGKDASLKDEDSENGDSLGSQEYQSLLDIDFLQSPVIEVGNKDDGNHCNWLIKIMKSVDDPNCIDLHLELNHAGSEFDEDEVISIECFFKYKIEIIGVDGQPVVQKRNDKIIYLKSGSSWNELGIIKVDFLRDHLDEILQDDTLRLQIDIQVLNDLHHSLPDTLVSLRSSSRTKKRKTMDNECNEQVELVDSCQMTLAKQILSTLWKTRSNSDATLECYDLKFHVHKSILSSASPVFSAAFTLNMSENLESRIVINDISPETLEFVLRFVYCDTSLDEQRWRNMDNLAELLNAAEKYQIQPLKTVGFLKLCEEMNLNNAAQATILVYLFEPEDSVRKFVHQYVMNNISVLKVMESFKKKLRESPAAFTPLLLLLGD